MRHGTRLVLLACVTALGVTALGSLATGASAASPKWWVQGAQFTGEETLTITSTGAVTMRGQLTKSSLGTIQCERLTTLPPPEFHEKGEEEAWYKKHPAPRILASSEEKWEMVFTGCKFSEPAVCGISGQLVGRNGIGGLVEEGTNIYDKFGASTQEFLVYTVSGCAGEGPITIKGAPRCKLLEPNTESVVKRCEFSATSGSNLTSGLQPVTLTATVTMELSGAKKGKPWTGRSTP